MNRVIPHRPQDSPAGGSVYIRWGRTTCPNIPGTELVYRGIAAGSRFNQQGGGSQYLCLPPRPKYANFRFGLGGHSPLHGVEYMPLGGPLSTRLQNFNVPCAVCCTNRSKLFMLPARDDCPRTWTREYSGYLMTAHRLHYRTSFECVDRFSQSIPGTGALGNGARFYHIEATCDGIPCPYYNYYKELTCAVCTK